MGDNIQITAIATIIAAVIAALAAIATQRSAAAAAVRNQTVSSRTDIEKEAFERAKGFYTDTIDRQAASVHELEDDVVSLKSRVRALEEELARERERNEKNEGKIRSLQEQLDLAQRALRLKYPDE
jgi:signal transduction histidine kinase